MYQARGPGEEASISINALKLTVRPVTVRAYAQPTPGRPGA